jgi:hypothetical protein
MTRSYDEIEKLIQDAGVPRRSPIARLITTTAENLNAAETQITAKISFLRDTLSRVEAAFGETSPHFSPLGELQRTAAEADQLLTRFEVLNDQLGMLTTAASEAAAP